MAKDQSISTGPEDGAESEKQRREKLFARRLLLQAGWVAPIVVMLEGPLGAALALVPDHADTTQVGAHTDQGDGRVHHDVRRPGLDPLHSDHIGHDDDTPGHIDGPLHHDHVGPYHTDGSEHTDGYNHGHVDDADPGPHTDGHTGPVHGDHYGHDDHIAATTPTGSGIHTDDHASVHTDLPPGPQHINNSHHTDTHV